MRLLILNGPPQSGKDTIASLLMEARPEDYTHVKFATPMRDHVCKTHGIKDSEIEYFKDDASLTENGVGVRQAMINCAQALKESHGAGALGYMAANRITKAQLEKTVIVTDSGGFKEEYWDFVKGCAFKSAWNENIQVIIVQLYREGCTFEGDSRQYHEAKDIIASRNVLNYLGNQNAYCVAMDEIHNSGTTDELMLEVYDAMSLFHWT